MIILRSQPKGKLYLWQRDLKNESVLEREPEGKQHRVSQQHAEHLVCPSQPDQLIAIPVA